MTILHNKHSGHNQLMLKAIEKTEWEYNHTYLLSFDKMKCHGYWPWHDGEFVKFTKPMQFDKRARKFKYVKIS